MRRRAANTGKIADLLDVLDQAFDHASWHGTNLRGSLRGITAADASRRPGKGRHNVWELAVHAAYWKYVVRRRLLGEKRGSFPKKGLNFFESPRSASPAAWKADLALLDQMHARLRSAVASFDPRDLPKRTAQKRWTNAQLISGAAAHDLYHAGQIQLVKRIVRSEK